MLISNGGFYLRWGLCSKTSHVPLDDVETNSNEEIYVFNSVFAIINNFFKDNDPDIVFYWVHGKREFVYDKMFDKVNMSNYEKICGPMNTFLIKKELL